MNKSVGRFVWYELAVADPEAAKAFYTSVVGWGAEEATAGSGYTLFTAGDLPVAGLATLQAGSQENSAPPQWMGYIGLDDVDAAARRVNKLGGTVIVPPTDLPDAGRLSVVADPQGAALALIKAQRPEEASERPTAPGHPVWRELIASDWETAFLFYHKLLGWEKGSATGGPAGNYQEFSAGAETIGGTFSWPDMAGSAIWVYYFGVSDVEAAATRAVARGGEILYGPVTVPGAARVLQCRDPQGAVFGLMDRRVRITIGCYTPRESQERR